MKVDLPRSAYRNMFLAIAAPASVRMASVSPG